MSTGIFKDKVYASEIEFCCCDSEDDLDKHRFDTFDFSENGIVIVNNNIIGISEEQFIVYEDSITDKLCIVYKPYTDEIEMCYRDSIVETDEMLFSKKYSVFYSIGSNLEFARHLDNASTGGIMVEDCDEIITLYSNYMLDTFYNCAECIDNVYRIGSVHWTDERIEQDTFIVENGCQAFFIIAESINANELVLPPSIKIFDISDEAGLRVEKVYLSKALKGSEVADMMEDSILDDLEIEYY